MEKEDAHYRRQPFGKEFGTHKWKKMMVIFCQKARGPVFFHLFFSTVDFFSEFSIYTFLVNFFVFHFLCFVFVWGRWHVALAIQFQVSECNGRNSTPNAPLNDLESFR